jgi:type IV pilus assembly protein PilF
MALVQIKLKKPDNAERYFKKAIAKPDPLPNAEHDYANYLCKRAEYEKAEELYRSLLDNPLYNAQARLLLSIGGCLFNQKKYDEAKNALKQSLRLAPNSTATLYTLARISHLQGDPLETRGWYQRYFQLTKNSNPEILYIAYLTEKQLGDLDSSATYALKLKNLYPLSSQAKKLNR